jgi:hypothetical protein
MPLSADGSAIGVRAGRYAYVRTSLSTARARSAIAAELLGEAARRAGERELVGLREMECDVGNAPALASRRPLPERVVQRIEQRGKFRVLLPQRAKDRLHKHLRGTAAY